MDTVVATNAVIRTGGQQYRVSEGDVVRVAKLDRAEGESVTFEEVLALGGTAPVLGQPLVAGATVEATVVHHGRGKKIVVFKFKRRKRFKHKMGHRQDYTEVKIASIRAPS
jgi:large subunit ribosomal protein L21